MSRVRATSLVLVNWRAVFYENYALDEHVTALEGDNGAGKTTVMIAAYVVLLPDMTRLRFTNVGEGEATGGDKGIHGRLGGSGRPSYSVIEFDVDGERLLAGIRLEPKGEPAVDLTPFIVTELPASLRLQDLLLLREGDRDQIPELDELRENATRLGARFHRCRTTKEYFSMLFERGITPLRLVSDEDRNRFGDMLRTSMTGGISRALTAELRSFLLKEERGLADTLVRMRGNLEACRRTRTEVQDARALEREISGVYEAGHAMFSAAMSATRERADEMRRRVDEATAKRDEAARERDLVADERDRVETERDLVATELVEVRAAYQSAGDVCARVEQANRIEARMRGHLAEFELTSIELTHANTSLDQATLQRDQREREQARAEADYTRAATGLANMQAGLEQLHRRADAHRMVRARLAEACEVLEVDTIEPARVDAQRVALTQEKQQLDTERGQLDERIETAQGHRRRHEQAMQALVRVIEAPLDQDDSAHPRAVAALAQLSALEGLAAQLEGLTQQLASAQEQAARQRAARQLAQTLARVPDELALGTQAQVKAEVARVDLELDTQQSQLHALATELAELARDRERDAQRERDLEARANRWRELDALATRLEGELGEGLRSADELAAARDLLDDHADELRTKRDALTQAIEGLNSEARALAHSGGAFPDALLAARDAVEGQLLAGYFDDIEPERAGRAEAMLGPLAAAIVVEDASAAAAQLSGLERDLDTIYLVEGPRAAALVDRELDDDAGGSDVTVVEADALRVTRISARPTLGHEARKRRIAELHHEIEQRERTRTEVERQLGQVSSRRRELTILLSELDTLSAGDPADELRELADARRDATQRAATVHERQTTLGQAHRAASRRAQQLRELLAEAHWLDLEDLGQRAAALADRRREAQRAREQIARTRAARTTLIEQLDALRHPPLSDTELAALRVRFEQLGVRRQALFSALDALGYVVEHREALAWTDASAALDATEALLPALEDQDQRAQAERDAALEAAREAQTAHAEIQAQWHEIDARHKAINAQLARTRQELADTGVDDASDAALAHVREHHAKLAAKLEALSDRDREIDKQLAALGERLRARQQKLDELQEQLTSHEREWQPSRDRWERLRSRAEAEGLISAAIAQRLLVSGGGSINLNSEALSHSRGLLERLGTARGGREILERIRTWLDGQDAAGDNYLQAWSVVRDWLRRRVPAQVAEVDDPLEALEHLRNHLGALDARLARDEDTLRGTSEDVANGIDVHIRAAHKQVRRLNTSLDGVHFGTIQSMRIRLERKPEMERVLGALRKGAAQELLFETSMPIEQALELLFSRHGSGRTGGQKLLDYREYLTITVEILRQAQTSWERVNASRVSTGEAIGIGAALMMVVLTAWERAANLLRAKRSLGTLRLLFLDEANRLSRDNLEVLFDLCRSLDLQLLIAAPEVARAQGCTTYRLVRRKTADGGEEVLVSGRRVRAEVEA